MKILNPGNSGDFHMHSINFSDGFNTIDELVIHAGKIGLKKIAITDHSQATISSAGLGMKTFRGICRSWRNVHNDVEVVFGVEGDILSASGDTSLDIQGFPGEFTLLSFHPYKRTYQDDPTKLTEAYINALTNNPGKIQCVAHPCMKIGDYGPHLDIKTLVRFCNEQHIPLEFNGKNLMRGKTDLEKLKILLGEANEIYVNSDAHTLYELETARNTAFAYLKDNGYSWE